MAGKCILCNNLEGKKIILNDEVIDCARCNIGKFDKDGVHGYFSISKILKSYKSIVEIEDECDKWDDRMKPKAIN